jgi:hypothetical protein
MAPANATYQYHLGLAQLKVGNTAAARAALGRAIELGPEASVAAEARRALDEIDAAAGQRP